MLSNSSLVADTEAMPKATTAAGQETISSTLIDAHSCLCYPWNRSPLPAEPFTLPVESMHGGGNVVRGRQRGGWVRCYTFDAW
jgi:hypothetical protein